MNLAYPAVMAGHGHMPLWLIITLWVFAIVSLSALAWAAWVTRRW